MSTADAEWVPSPAVTVSSPGAAVRISVTLAAPAASVVTTELAPTAVTVTWVFAGKPDRLACTPPAANSETSTEAGVRVSLGS